ncbi:PREDICTED: zinc carboxypeptidase-like [Papilio xuthus]|uniref:Zinc carboxypeptidase-like n=1 Tax=Papilio xuthus TaxID=66420 RepID=A0AAJ7EBG7_PAPXU|nr:PREDICTED: zinc carboxypeptidase-like [Papilio xuthus]
MFLKLFIILLLTITFVNTNKVTFNGHRVYKVIPNNDNEKEVVTNIQKQGIGEFWFDQFDVYDGVRITVAPEKIQQFQGTMRRHNIVYKEIIADLQQVIDDQLKPASRSERSTSFLSFNWDRYHTLDEIYNWLDQLHVNYPNIVTTVVMGRSVENREIKGIKINYNPNRNNTLIGMIEGTLHAREWIVPATATWIIKEFLTSTDPEMRALAQNIEWHIFPVVNPDGYVYTFTTHRMWRKNRSTRNFTSCASTGVHDDMSNGVDLNRNFDFAWMEIGASDNPCTNTFAGPSPFSEPEARAVADYVLMLNNQGRLIYYFGLHSYTQLIVVPYSHITAEESSKLTNYADMYEIAARGAEKLKERFGTEYRVGVSADIMYPMSGTSFDWVKNVTDVPVSFLIELRDLGEYGFLLPASQIIPNNLEIMDALLEIDRTTRRLGYYYSGTNSLISSMTLIGLLIFVKLFVN